MATNGPLAAASKMVPVPETLMSPDVCPAAMAQRVTVSVLNSQLQNSKSNKNKDNKMNSPKIRSPHLSKSSTERSPHMSPRRFSHTNIVQQHNVANTNKMTVDNQTAKMHLTGNTMHVPATEIGSGTLSSDDDSDHINIDKLRTIHNKAAQRCHQSKETVAQVADSNKISAVDTVSSAVLIQKMWRGYRTRKKTKDIAEKLLRLRTQEYIEKLTKDMELTKAQLENERKIQQLQMQAISALWKKVSSMQEGAVNSSGNEQASVVAGSDNRLQSISLDNNSTAVVNDLTQTCCTLTNQVQQLQGSMRDILNCLTIFCNLPQENVKKLLSAGVNEALNKCEMRDSAATQTEIVAVHTPLIENQSNFPFSKARPSTLPLEMQQTQNSNELKAEAKIPVIALDESSE